LFLSCPEKFHTGHWIVDFLPRLRALKHIPPGFKIATPTELPRKHRDLLSLFGVEEGQIVNCDLGRRYRFRNLVVTQPGIDHRPSPDTVRFVADALRRPRNSGEKAARLFVRRGIPTRNIVNENEVKAELDRLGFEEINLETASVAEQRDRLSAADIVIAVHGSDPLVCYFMNPGSDLIELNYDPMKLNAAIAPRCEVLGLGYHLLVCEPREPSHRRLKKDRDFVVDCGALREMIEGIIQRKSA
jgi:capsular polysaccharide biosynthesis protein